MAKKEPLILIAFQCKRCGHQTTVTAGTVLENSQIPLRKWFLAIYLAAQDKRGVSATLIAKEIAAAYVTVWLIMAIPYLQG
jgi:transposase-like protein